MWGWGLCERLLPNVQKLLCIWSRLLYAQYSIQGSLSYQQLKFGAPRTPMGRTGAIDANTYSIHFHRCFVDSETERYPVSVSIGRQRPPLTVNHLWSLYWIRCKWDVGFIGVKRSQVKLQNPTLLSDSCNLFDGTYIGFPWTDLFHYKY